MDINRGFQRPSTRFCPDGRSVWVVLNVDRRMYEYAREWARHHALADPEGTAEDQLEGHLNMALINGMCADNWEAPSEIEALYPAPEPLGTRPNDLNDDIPF